MGIRPSTIALIFKILFHFLAFGLLALGFVVYLLLDIYEPLDAIEAWLYYTPLSALFAALLYLSVYRWIRSWMKPLVAACKQDPENPIMSVDFIAFVLPLPLALLLAVAGNVCLDNEPAQNIETIIIKSEAHHHITRRGGYDTYHLYFKISDGGQDKVKQLDVPKNIAEAAIPGVSLFQFQLHPGAFGVRWVDWRQIKLLNPDN